MAYYSDPNGHMSFPNSGNSNVYQNELNHFNPYGYSHVGPICHICGIHGHTPAECQCGAYAPTPDCFGMNFAQQHGSYHGNYSPGWPENPDMTYRNNSPPVSSFSPSYPMQEFRCAEKNQYNQHQYYASPTYAQEIYQEQPQFGAQSTPLEEQPSWMDEIKKQQQELMDQINSQMMQLNERLSQTATPEPGHQPQKYVPMELNDPPEVQAPTRELDDTDKLSLLYLEYTWSAEDDPLRPVIIKEMKKIKDGSDLAEELKKIEKNMNLGNSISSQLELELSAPVIPLDTCEVLEPSHTSEPVSESPGVERSQILEEQKSHLECASDHVEDRTPIIPEDKEATGVRMRIMKRFKWTCMLSYKSVMKQVYVTLLMTHFLMNPLPLPCVA